MIPFYYDCVITLGQDCVMPNRTHLSSSNLKPSPMLLLPNKKQKERTSRMYDRTLAIYCFIDDLLKAMQHSEDSRCQFSDAEVVTTAIVAMLFYGGNFEHSRQFLHSSGMMLRMLS